MFLLSINKNTLPKDYKLKGYLTEKEKKKNNKKKLEAF